MKPVILVDGGFYRRRAQKEFGNISAPDWIIEIASLSNYIKIYLVNYILL